MEKGRFREIFNQIAERSSTGDLSNFYVCEKMGLPAWKGVLAVMAEEMGRLLSLAKAEDIEPVSVAELLTELAVHSVTARMLVEEPQGDIRQDSGSRRGRRPKERKDPATEAVGGDALPGASATTTDQE